MMSREWYVTATISDDQYKKLKKISFETGASPKSILSSIVGEALDQLYSQELDQQPIVSQEDMKLDFTM